MANQPLRLEYQPLPWRSDSECIQARQQGRRAPNGSGIQAQKFDPDGDYVRHWVPELAKLPHTWIHEPWKASPKVLEEADIELGQTYPLPIVNYTEGRKRALEASQQFKKTPRRRSGSVPA